MNDFHIQCRSAVAALIEAERTRINPPTGLLGLRKTIEQKTFAPNLLTAPLAVCYLVSQPFPVGGTSGSNDWKFPIVVGLLTTGTPNGDDLRSNSLSDDLRGKPLNKSGPESAAFLGTIAAMFHAKRPTGVPGDVYLCEIDSQGNKAIEEEKHQQLRAVTVVTMTARIRG